MANGADPQRSHTKFIVSCITLMGICCAVAGSSLIWKGYHGDLLIGGALAAISGLTGLLGQSKPQPPPQDITMTAGPPPKVEVTQPKPEEQKP